MLSLATSLLVFLDVVIQSYDSIGLLLVVPRFPSRIYDRTMITVMHANSGNSTVPHTRSSILLTTSARKVNLQATV